MSIYLDLTRQFNEGALRAILSSGQAAVLHRLAIMSKDGDWILREDAEALSHVLQVLDRRQARYRFGAPLDLRWMRGGWSAHLEFADRPLRIRTDFVTRPPRLPVADLEALWQESRGNLIPHLDARRLAEIKKTNREKDYAVIGELARRLPEPRDQLLLSRSARDILALARRWPALASELAETRPALASIDAGLSALEAALDAERRTLMHKNEARLQAYLQAAQAWRQAWPEVERRIAGLPLMEAHAIVAQGAEDLLPPQVSAESGR
ncbi:MAG TPA: hypothetical protein VJU18_16655 [Vicinamibacteria bacterium]|nr:hypothetical protein [Vicinamibacteria bacterium]